MDILQRIPDFETIKTLADERRLRILRLLMRRDMTLSHLGEALGEHPARIRHHLKKLEDAGLVRMTDTRIVRGFVEKYYRAEARTFSLQELILPEMPEDTLVVLGSHDFVLESMTQNLGDRERHAINLMAIPIGSLEGLIALRQGNAKFAGCHLLDAESGEYNLPYIRHLFPDQDISLVTLAHRDQGLLLAPGNPKGIRGLADLARTDVAMINRNRGSGTRLWLEVNLPEVDISPEGVSGFDTAASTHTAVAEAVERGDADVGLGLRAAAQAYGLDFILLFQERFDLAFFKEIIDDPEIRPMLDYLTSGGFRQLVTGIPGYSNTHSGDQLNP